MTRHPASDERTVAGVQRKGRKGEWFLVTEVALFLRAGLADILALLRKRRRLRRMWVGCQRDPKWTTDAQGVALCVVFFRSVQADRELMGDRAPKLRERLRKS